MLAFISLIALASAVSIPINSTVFFSSPELAAIAPSLNGAYQFPHLIIPTNKLDPQQAPGTQYWAEISTTKTTIFQFDIPNAPEYVDNLCDVVFMFPYKDDIKLAPKYEWSGLEAQEYSDGGIIFSLLGGPVNQATTFANAPQASMMYPKKQLKPGSVTYIATGWCDSVPRQVAFSADGRGNFDLRIFQSQEAGAYQGLFIIPHPRS